ncbi:MAG: hypothetical protein KGN77_02100 [Xanthomonadaceae bacterium]|nr:hypothetical protein [Xanthomonadaceae bacterium]
MSRRCDCSVVLDELARNPALATAPLAARAVWLALVRAMQAAGVSVLRWGSHVPNRAELAMLVAASETETETEINRLVARGLLVLEPDDAIASPLLGAAAKRSETNRINGMKGGRPRKDGTDRRQAGLLLPIAGDAPAATAKTEPKPNAPPGQLKLASSLEEKASSLDLATSRLLGTAGLGTERLRSDRGIVARWLSDGHDLNDIADLIARRVDAGAQPQHLGYFDRAVAELMPSEPPAPVARRPEMVKWERDYNEWKDMGGIGPMPVPPPSPSHGTRAA